MSKLIKIGRSLARNALFDAPTCLVSSSPVFLWPHRVYEGSCNTDPFPRFPSRLSCHFAWQAWHLGDILNLFDNASKVSNLAEVLHEVHVLLLPRVSSRVSGFPVASLCLWGKLHNISFSKVSKQVVHVVLRGRRGTLSHSNLLDNMTKIQEISHEKLIFLRPRVSSRVFGFPVTSPCLSGKLYTPHFPLHTPQFTL